MGLCDDVRRQCAGVVAEARWVSIDAQALARFEVDCGWGAVDAGRAAAGAQQPPPPAAGLDPECHYLEGEPDAVAAYVLALAAINFGSGWFPTLRKRPGYSGYRTIAGALADRFRQEGAWSNAELRALGAEELAGVLGQPADHELMGLYAQGLRSLGGFLGERRPLELVDAAGGSGERLAEMLARGMAMFGDVGFYKRAQIAASDLALAGVADFGDLDRLTIFADNLVPHVLRCAGVLRYEAELAERIDAGVPLRPGGAEREIRASAVHACELLSHRLGMAPRVLDGWLWNRGQAPDAKAVPRHRCRCVFY